MLGFPGFVVGNTLVGLAEVEGLGAVAALFQVTVVVGIVEELDLVTVTADGSRFVKCRPDQGAFTGFTATFGYQNRYLR